MNSDVQIPSQGEARPTQVILFDVDGVLTLPEEMFSEMYTKSHSLDPVPFKHFLRLNGPTL